ncbi:TPA: ATP-binding protein [Serratia fonticola]|uniref:ATP-binding protein n=1 Tax=Serratia fonticola TaxID=47917 RepID=UPI0021BD72E4|nr:transporter substrate-binding domain-containing protein [Serratia fonticola]
MIGKAAIMCLILLSSCLMAEENSPSVGKQFNLVSREQTTLPEPTLSGSDWQWLRHKRTLIFGTSAPNDPPYDINTGWHDYDGINADYLDMIGKNLNMQIQVIHFEDYPALIAALKRGDIDLIANASGEEQKQQGLLLTTPYQASSPAFVVRADNRLPTKSPKVIALDRFYSQQNSIKQRFADASFEEYDSPRRALEAVSFNSMEAFIGDSISINYIINQSNLSNLRLKTLQGTGLTGFSFALAGNNLRLQRILNAVLSQIPDSTKVTIQKRWSGGQSQFTDNKHLFFTSLERKWIEENPVILVAINGDFTPLNFFDEQGNFRGLTADVFNTLTQRTGLTFKFIHAKSLQDSLNKVKAGKSDAVAGITLDATWLNGLLTTRSYLFNSWVLIGPKSLQQNLLPQKIALVEGHPLNALLRKIYPASKIIWVKNPQAGIDAINTQQADTLVLPLISANFLLAHQPAANLMILKALDIEPARFVIGISDNEYPLATILDKALLSIPPEDLHAMTSNWYHSAPQSLGYRDENQAMEYYQLKIIILLSMLLMLLTVLAITYVKHQRRLAQQRQAETAQRQQSLIDAIPIPLYITNLKEEITQANASFINALNEDASKVIGNKLDTYNLSLVTAEEHTICTTASDPHALYVTRQLTLSGQQRAVQQWNTLFLPQGDHAEGKIGGWFDITEREQLIVQLRQSNAEAENASRAKSTFLATMSHEIRTPLNAVIGMLELALRQHQQGDEPRYDLLQTAYDSSHSLLALIGDILDISRIESDRLILTPERSALRDLIESVATLFEGLARQKGLIFKLEIDAEIVGDVLIDPLRFKQILSNLVSNAIKFTSQGQVALTALVDNISDERLDFHITITDSGKGIDPQTQQRLFKPFAQGQSASASSGAGLGLYICRKLVEMMGGTIMLTSEPELGSKVTISLSILRLPKLDSPLQPAVIQATDKRSLHILVVEDNQAGRLLLVQQLNFLGHRVSECEDGVEALAFLGSQPVDLVITDCQMPHLDGFAFTRQLRQKEHEQQQLATPVWGLTANAQQSAIEECLQAGMNNCLFKPVGLSTLTESLRTLPSSSPCSEENQEPVFDLMQLAEELRKPAILRQLIDTLLECLQADHLQLESEATLQPLRTEPIRQLAHKVLGSGRLIHAKPMIDACLSLDATPDNANMTLLLYQMEHLITALQNHQRLTSM